MGAPPYIPGQFSNDQGPQQAAALPQQQAPQQPQTADPLEVLKQRLVEQATPPAQQPSSGVKGLLQNFFQGFGNAAMHEAGLPTPYERQQKALSDLSTITNTQAMQQFHQASMAQFQPVPLVGLDQKPILGPDGKVITLPAGHAQTFYAGQAAAAARLGAAQETAEHRTITVPGVGAFNWDNQQGKYVPVQGGQVPQHVLQPGEAEQYGFMPGTTSVPESVYSQAVGAATKPLTTIQGANDQYQLNRLSGQKTALGVGNPRIAAQNARPVQVSDPTVPGGIRYVPAGEAMRQGLQSSSSSAVKVPAGVLKDFTSGASAKTLNSFNTATDHLRLLSDLGDALNNGNVPLINQLGNRFSTATGGAAPTNFNMAKNAVAGEIAKTFKGNATEGEISSINQTLNNAQSPTQLKGAIQTALTLMNSKRQALLEQYDQGIKGAPAFPGGGTQPTGNRVGFAQWKARQNGQ